MARTRQALWDAAKDYDWSMTSNINGTLLKIRHDGPYEIQVHLADSDAIVDAILIGPDREPKHIIGARTEIIRTMRTVWSESRGE
jgi:hypothetical protein